MKNTKNSGSGSTVFSGALNNLNYLSGGVDAQTLLYSFTIDFGTLTGAKSFGPKFDLKMMFSALGTLGDENERGLGRGWSFDLPFYDSTQQLITLPGGRSFKVYNSNFSDSSKPDLQNPWATSYKLKDIGIYGITVNSNQMVLIVLKTGEEYLLAYENPYGYLYKYTAPNGQYLIFDFNHKGGEVYQLIGIEDDSQKELLQVDYDSTYARTTLNLYPETTTVKTFALDHSGTNHTLKEFTILGNGESLVTSFKYKEEYLTLSQGGSVLMSPISEVVHPSGAIEQIDYDGQIYPPAQSPWADFLPGVSEYRQYNTYGSLETSTYQSSSELHNFLGKGASGVTWEDATDSLANHIGSYTYKNTVVIGNKTTTYQFNKFHQLRFIEEWFGNTEIKKVIELKYYTDGKEDRPLNEQVYCYNLQKSVIITLQDHSDKDNLKSKVLQTDYQYDNYGNILSQQNVDGTQVTNTYYTENPEIGSGCPAHPYGMQAFLKQAVYKPASDNFSTPSKITDFTYKGINKIDSTEAVFIVPETETFAGQITTFTYYNTDKSKPYYGKPHTKSISLNDKTTIHTYGYAIDDNKLSMTATETITGHDDATMTRSESKNYLNGQVVEQIDREGVITSYEYDPIGRVIAETHGVGSAYASKTDYKYIAIPDLTTDENYDNIKENIGYGWVIQEKNISEQAEIHTYYDGAKREIREYRKDTNGTFRKVSQIDYDGQGRKDTQWYFDYDLKVDSETTYTKSSTHTYGDWGEVKEKVSNDGIIQIQTLDPFKLQVTLQTIRRDDVNDPSKITEAINPTRITFDLFKNIRRIKRLDDEGKVYSRKTMVHDGFGRLKSIVNSAGDRARIGAYDSFDRMQSFLHFDKTLHTVAYADFSSESLLREVVAIIAKSEQKLGAQNYDGIGRIVSREVLGTTTHFTYPTGSGTLKPAKSLNTRGQTTLFSFVPELNQPSRIATYTTGVEIGDWNNTSIESYNHYTYTNSDDTDWPLGQLKNATDARGNKYDYNYTSIGTLASTIQTVDDTPKTILNDHATLLGKVRSATVNGRSITLNYDDQGKLEEMIDGNIKIETGFNSFGSIQSEKIFEGDILIQTTEITYDSFGRESLRTITAGQTTTIQSSFNQLDKLISRTVTSVAGTLTETFEYDAKSRLIKYATNAEAKLELLPTGQNGKPFTTQTFKYDGLDNITELTTTFPNSQEMDTATYTYTNNRLRSITHSLTSGDNAYWSPMFFDYDEDGNLISIDEERMTYTVSGRLKSRAGVNYVYDAFNRLLTSGDTTRLYLKDEVINEFDAASNLDKVNFIKLGNATVAEIAQDQTSILGRDHKNSVFSVTSGATTTPITYTPYGGGSSSTRTGFAGNLKDVSEGHYPLGNGTRAYLPGLAAFSSMDSYSPFSGGGLNPYRYCHGDPINLIDPSGHISHEASLGLGIAFFLIDILAFVLAIPSGGTSLAIAAAATTLGGVSSTLGIAADSMAIADENQDKDRSTTEERLGVASTAFGMASLLVGGFGESATKGVKKMDEHRKSRKSKKAEGPSQHNTGRGKDQGKDQAQQPNKIDEDLSNKGLGKSILQNTLGYDSDKLALTSSYDFITGKLSKGIDSKTEFSAGLFNITGSTGGLVFWATTSVWNVSPQDNEDLAEDKYGLPKNPEM